MNETAKNICATLQDEGFQAFLVGGCVRDTLLGETPNDWDIVTNACPPQIRTAFSSRFVVKDVGAAFGVVLLHDPVTKEEFEVATFREDQFVDGADGRHPSSIRVNVTSKEDSARRDFTVNALLLNPISGEIVDHVNGRADVASHIIRFVGSPDKRIEEDALRMLRAVRFTLKLGWDMDEAAFRAIRKNAEKITRISAERITLELEKMIKCHNPRRMLTFLSELGLLTFILPEVEVLKGVVQDPRFHPEGDVFTHTRNVVHELRKEPFELQLAGLLHDIGKPGTFTQDEKGIHNFGHEELSAKMAEDICRRLKLSVEQTERIVFLVDNHMKFHNNVSKMKVSTLRRLLANPFFEDLRKLVEADVMGSDGNMEELLILDTRIKTISALAPIRDLPTPLINGNDLIERGLKPGPNFKTILTRFMDMQLEDSELTRESALIQLDDLIAGKEPGE